MHFELNVKSGSTNGNSGENSSQLFILKQSIVGISNLMLIIKIVCPSI